MTRGSPWCDRRLGGTSMEPRWRPQGGPSPGPSPRKLRAERGEFDRASADWPRAGGRGAGQAFTRFGRELAWSPGWVHGRDVAGGHENFLGPSRISLHGTILPTHREPVISRERHGDRPDHQTLRATEKSTFGCFVTCRASRTRTCPAVSRPTVPRGLPRRASPGPTLDFSALRPLSHGQGAAWPGLEMTIYRFACNQIDEEPFFEGGHVGPAKTLRSRRPASPDVRSVELCGRTMAGERTTAPRPALPGPPRRVLRHQHWSGVHEYVGPWLHCTVHVYTHEKFSHDASPVAQQYESQVPQLW
jgi:hypothetical protein